MLAVLEWPEEEEQEDLYNKGGMVRSKLVTDSSMAGIVHGLVAGIERMIATMLAAMLDDCGEWSSVQLG